MTLFDPSDCVNRPRAWTLAASVLFHMAAIAVVAKIHTPVPLRPPVARVTLIAPAPVRIQPAPRMRHRAPVRPAVGRSPAATFPAPLRAFRVPHRLSHAPTETILIAPEPPPIYTRQDLPRMPAPIIELPVAAPVRPAGFSSAETRAPAPARHLPAATGAFDAPPSSAREAARREVTAGAFGDASVAPAAPRSVQAAAAANFLAAEILFKPRPAYTDEARRLRIEGEVLLEVLFSASGDARVVRTIRGLGHGLDETAVAAAREIRFRPARRGSAEVDSLAVVHIVFQLAY